MQQEFQSLHSRKPFTSAIRITNIVNLANLALEEVIEMAVEILGFVLVNTKI
jgi:hypothetical protein